MQEICYKKRYTLDEILRRKKPKLLSQEQREDALDKVRNFFKQYRIEQFTLEEKGWETVYEILRDLNVSAPDAIQLATAKEANCTMFLSNDEELGKEAQKILKWMTSGKANEFFETKIKK